MAGENKLGSVKEKPKAAYNMDELTELDENCTECGNPLMAERPEGMLAIRFLCRPCQRTWYVMVEDAGVGCPDWRTCEDPSVRCEINRGCALRVAKLSTIE